MDHNPDAWDRVADLAQSHGVQVMLLQEAVPPPSGHWTTFPAASDLPEWTTRAHVDKRRAFATAVVLLDSALTLRGLTTVPLGQADSQCLPISHPGQFTAADLLTPNGSQITLVSLYGIWEQDEHGLLYTEATLHRAISDLTVLFQDPARTNILVAGDLNIFHNWDQASKDAYWAPRYDTVFNRLASYDLELAGPFAEHPLAECLCRSDTGCRHVRTFAYRRDPVNPGHNQLDYVFASRPLREAGIRCGVDDRPENWSISDHLPVITHVSLPITDTSARHPRE